MQRERIEVDRLQYESSPVGLARLLRRCRGIVSVEIDSAAGVAEITYDESVTPSELRQLIAQCGYGQPYSAHSTHGRPITNAGR